MTDDSGNSDGSDDLDVVGILFSYLKKDTLEKRYECE